MKTIRQLRAAGITIVSITHYMEEAAQADRVLVMSRGRIVMEARPSRCSARPSGCTGITSMSRRPPSCATSWSRPDPMPENVITPDACAEELYKLLK